MFRILFIIVCIVQTILSFSNSNLEIRFFNKLDGVVETDCGFVQGYKNSFLKNHVWAFKGIPYAVPPIGKHRWQPSTLLSEANQYVPIFSNDFNI